MGIILATILMGLFSFAAADPSPNDFVLCSQVYIMQQYCASRLTPTSATLNDSSRPRGQPSAVNEAEINEIIARKFSDWEAGMEEKFMALRNFTMEEVKDMKVGVESKMKEWQELKDQLDEMKAFFDSELSKIANGAKDSSSNDSAPFEVSDKSLPREVLHNHVRCNNDVIMAEDEDDESLWRNYNNSAHVWKSIPYVENTGYVLISPKYRLEEGYPGVQISILLPKENARFHIMAVTPELKHSSVVTIEPKKYRCESIGIDDPSFFNGEEVVFRIYVFYNKHMPVRGIKFTVTTLPLAVRYKSPHFRSTVTTIPNFKHLKIGDRDVCSVEIENSERQCDWWNVEDGDNADFEAVESHDCVDSGARTTNDATWFFAIDPHEVEIESRALLISPIIERTTPSVLLTMWYILKCDSQFLRVRLIPAEEISRRRGIATSDVIAEFDSPASHNDWKFVSLQISLPPEHDAYHVVLEGIVIANGNCSKYFCTLDGSGRKKAQKPMLGVDSLTLELMLEQCENTTGASVVNCKFQTKSGDPTTCGWISSAPSFPLEWNMPGFENYWNDWKTANSGDGADHGATSQHLEGRGYIMSFDASGRAQSESYFRTPLLVASGNCSCVMEFQYLMRGIFTPRMQVNMIYGDDINDNTREMQPQWSLYRHQSEDWQVATIAINLKTGTPFQIEIRVLDINYPRGDVHVDDIHFIGCDMQKHNS